MLKIKKISGIAKLFISVLIIVIAEGAFRKWISNSLSTPFVLFRDSIVLYTVYFAFKNKLLKKTDYTFIFLVIFSYLIVVIGLIQILLNGVSPAIIVIGFRFWLLYLWFAYIIGIAVNLNDLKIIANYILFVMVLMLPLVVFQHFSPPHSFINKQVEDSFETVFKITDDLVRTNGFFTFTFGYTAYLALATPFVFFKLNNNEVGANKISFKIGLMLVMLVSVYISGSRAAMILLLLLYIIDFVFNIFSFKKKEINTVTFKFVVLIISIFFVAYYFDRATSANIQRFISANESEGFLARIGYSFFGVSAFLKDLKVFGHGLGMGTNFVAHDFLGKYSFILSESEFGRNILEAGLFGAVFIILKTVILFIGIKNSFHIYTMFGNSFPFLLWFSTSLAMLWWPIMGQLTVNAIGFMMLGLSVAANRIYISSSLNHSKHT